MARPRSNISERIREAASERFLAEGVDGASLRAIAADAKTNIGMIYYYYPTKEDLFQAVVEDVYSKLVVDLVAALTPDGSVEQRLQRLFERLGALGEDELRVLRLVVCESLRSMERFERFAQRFQAGHIALIAQLVQEAFGAGTFAAGRHPLVAMVSVVALAGFAQVAARFAGPRLPFANPPSGPALSRDLVQVLLHGLAASPTSRPPHGT